MSVAKNLVSRWRVASTLRSASTFMQERELHRLPVVYGTNRYFMTRDDLWVGFSIPHRNFGFLSDKEQAYMSNAAAGFFTFFPAEEENAGHLLVVNHTQKAADWEEALVARQRQLAREEGRRLPDSFDMYVDLARSAIDAQEFFSRDVYLFVKAAKRTTVKGSVRGVLEMLGRSLTAGFGIDDSQPSEEEQKEAQALAGEIVTSLARSWLAPAPIGRSKLEWIIRYLDSLGQPTPDVAPLDEQVWGIGKWQTSMSSWTRVVDLGKDIKGSRVRAVEFLTTTGEGRSYAAFLPLAIVPNEIDTRSNWLVTAATLPFSVDVSLHFEIVDPHRAERELDRPIDDAKAQAMEEQEAGRDPDETTLSQRAQLEAVQRNVRTNKQPLAFWQCVFAVYNDDPEQLKNNVTELRRRYLDLNMVLEIPPVDQRLLFYQTFPGSTIMVNDWIQRTDTSYLSASMPWLDSGAGASLDNPSLYQGFTILDQGDGQAKRGAPVFFDLVSVADEQGRAPVEAVVGDPGSGKTVSRGLKTAHENALKAITQFVWDPKGDFTPLYTEADSILLDKNDIRLIELGSSDTTISLDAFAIAEYDPAGQVDDRASTAQDVLNKLAFTLISYNKVARDVIEELVHVIIDQAHKAGRAPKMLDVFPILERWRDGDIQEVDLPQARYQEYAEAARGLYRVCDNARRSSVGRVIFLDPDQGTLNIKPGTTTIFNALRLREVASEPRPDENVEDTYSRILSEMMISYVRSLVTRLPDQVTKHIYFDEWHVIKNSRAAERLIDWLKRMGRSKRTAVTYMSQSADDVAGGTLNSVWAGKCETEANARASCELLEIDKNDYNINTLMNLDKGEFVFRGPDGRVARVKVDFWDPGVLAIFNTGAREKAAKATRQREREQERERGVLPGY